MLTRRDAAIPEGGGERETPAPAVRGPIGLDDRPRPASARARIIRGLKQSAPFSSLQRRIIFFNLIGLVLLVAGVTLLTTSKQNLIGVYVDALRKQGEIIAAGIAQTADNDPDTPGYDLDAAAEVLARLAQPTKVRIRLYDQTLHLTADTYDLSPAGPPIEVLRLPPPAEDGASAFAERFRRLYDRVSTTVNTAPPIHYEVPIDGISSAREVVAASLGQIAHEVRVNSQGEIVVSVAMPVRRLHSVLGVLRLSTVGGEIEQFVEAERRAVLQVFFIAACVSVLLSILLANMIASPIRLLANAARSEGQNAARPLNPEHPEIPDLTHRTDEIGDLSGALIRMTGALYNRIGAIESFAADVAHEIKNPLTSLRSAVETMPYAKTPEQRQKLVDVIRSDVNRLDRLVTDISNASRLDAELVRERMGPFDIAEVIRMLASVTESQGEDQSIRVVTDLPDGPLIAEGLEGRLAQVITNLLGNALSFSPEGGTIRITGTARPAQNVRVTVEDEGPGIPPENVKSIFERFYSERPDSEDFGNHSGLGLSISRQIVEAHGGRIWAENVPGADGPAGPPGGARFVFDLPGPQ